MHNHKKSQTKKSRKKGNIMPRAKKPLEDRLRDYMYKNQWLRGQIAKLKKELEKYQTGKLIHDKTFENIEEIHAQRSHYLFEWGQEKEKNEILEKCLENMEVIRNQLLEENEKLKTKEHFCDDGKPIQHEYIKKLEEDNLILQQEVADLKHIGDNLRNYWKERKTSLDDALLEKEKMELELNQEKEKNEILKKHLRKVEEISSSNSDYENGLVEDKLTLLKEIEDLKFIGDNLRKTLKVKEKQIEAQIFETKKLEEVIDKTHSRLNNNQILNYPFELKVLNIVGKLEKFEKEKEELVFQNEHMSLEKLALLNEVNELREEIGRLNATEKIECQDDNFRILRLEERMWDIEKKLGAL